MQIQMYLKLKFETRFKTKLNMKLFIYTGVVHDATVRGNLFRQLKGIHSPNELENCGEYFKPNDSKFQEILEKYINNGVNVVIVPENWYKVQYHIMMLVYNHYVNSGKEIEVEFIDTFAGNIVK